MILYELKPLNREIERVYNEHYKDCKHQAVHDFYRATMRRFRTAYQKNRVSITPIICCRECKFWKAHLRNGSLNADAPLERYGWCEVCGAGRLESDFCSCGRTREVEE